MISDLQVKVFGKDAHVSFRWNYGPCEAWIADFERTVTSDLNFAVWSPVTVESRSKTTYQIKPLNYYDWKDIHNALKAELTPPARVTSCTFYPTGYYRVAFEWRGQRFVGQGRQDKGFEKVFGLWSTKIVGTISVHRITTGPVIPASVGAQIHAAVMELA